MNKVEITKAPIRGCDLIHAGDLFEATANHLLKTGEVAVAHRASPGGELRLYDLASGELISSDSIFGSPGPAGWRRLPPGTVVTITVEED